MQIYHITKYKMQNKKMFFNEFENNYIYFEIWWFDESNIKEHALKGKHVY
jgi:hypothetical protein